MQDRPTYGELLAAIEHFLDDDMVPNTPGSRGFHARVAANAVRTVRRELEAEDEQLAAEWAALNGLLGPIERPAGRAALRETIAARNAELCERIRRGDADHREFGIKVREHVLRTVQGKLRVSNPDLLKRSEQTP